MKIARLDLWYRLKSDEQKVIRIKPRAQNIDAMKIDIAEALSPLMRRIKSYYVVFVVRKSDGSLGYRSMKKVVVQ